MQTKLFRRDFTLVVIGQIISLFGNAILRFGSSKSASVTWACVVATNADKNKAAAE